MGIHPKHRRLLALVLCILFVSALILSMTYLVKDSGHNCSDSHCPLCAQLEWVQKTIDQLGSALVLLLLFGSVLFSLHTSIFYCCSAATVPNTLVSQNVRMNN